MNDQASRSAAPGESQAWFLPMVALLLVVIVAALAVLWLNERRARLAAEQNLAQAARQPVLSPGLKALLEAQGAGAIQQMTPELGRAVLPVQREDLPRQTLELAGRPTAVLQVSAEAGIRLGFQPGDVIVVGQSPATRPAGQ